MGNQRQSLSLSRAVACPTQWPLPPFSPHCSPSLCNLRRRRARDNNKSVISSPCDRSEKKATVCFRRGCIATTLGHPVQQEFCIFIQYIKVIDNIHSCVPNHENVGNSITISFFSRFTFTNSKQGKRWAIKFKRSIVITIYAYCDPSMYLSIQCNKSKLSISIN